MKEIKVSEHLPDNWILSKRRADPLPPELVARVQKRMIEALRQDLKERTKGRTSWGGQV